jgi:hypothetical protein
MNFSSFLKMGRVVAKTLNDQSQTADGGWSFSCMVERGASSSSPWKISTLRSVTWDIVGTTYAKGSILWGIYVGLRGRKKQESEKKKIAERAVSYYALRRKCYLRDQTKGRGNGCGVRPVQGTKEVYKGLWYVNLKKRENWRPKLRWDDNVKVDSKETGW